MKAIDKITPPCTFYYEDIDGNFVPFDYQKGMPDHDKPWHAQHSKGVLVQHSICFGKRNKKLDAWPVRLLKWLLRKAPQSWKKSDISMSFHSTINSAYPIIKYLVEQRQFRFNDACVVASEMCGRCSDICEGDINGTTVIPNYNLPNVYCKFCDIIDPQYVFYRRVWACYRTMRMEGDVAKAYKEISPNSREGFFDDPKNEERLNGKVQPITR